MKRTVWTIVMVLLIAAGAFAGGKGEDGGSEMSADADAVTTMEGYSSASAAGVQVQWKVTGDSLSVQMAAETTGWVAVGFDPSRQMADANIIIGYVADGTVHLRDDYGTGNVRHGPDVENGGTDDLSDVEGEESGGMTVIRFTIPLDSGDAADKPLVPGSTYKIIVAHGSNGSDDFGSYHGSRGSFETEL